MNRLVYRSVGANGTYPGWLRALRSASGVYVIREPNGRVLYVGESHKGQLYKTITRHLQGWRREKKWWTGWFGQQHDPGTRYERGAVEVAAIRTPSGALALALQDKLIRRLAPKDNLIGAADDVPF